MASKNETPTMLKNPDKEFLLQDVLQIITGRMLSSSEDYDNIFDLMAYMLGHKIGTKQYPHGLEVCRKVLIEQHPQLEDYVGAEFDPEYFEVWLKKVYKALGLKSEFLPVKPASGEVKDQFRSDEEEAELMRTPPKKKKNPVTNSRLLAFEDEG